MQIEIPVMPDVSFENFSAFCKEFNCSVDKPKKGATYWKVSSDDALNFFWLGCNIDFKVNTPTSISPAAKFLKK